MSIKLTMKGFDSLLDEIQAAGGSVDQATNSALRQSAQIMQTELKNEMVSSGVPAHLINSMPNFEVEQEANLVSARVGYRKGEYDPDNLSDGYKVVFLNYGTPHRREHGKIVEGSSTQYGKTLKLGFIERAKINAAPKIKKEQKQALKKILKRLEK